MQYNSRGANKSSSGCNPHFFYGIMDLKLANKNILFNGKHRNSGNCLFFFLSRFIGYLLLCVFVERFFLNCWSRFLKPLAQRGDTGFLGVAKNQPERKQKTEKKKLSLVWLIINSKWKQAKNK